MNTEYVYGIYLVLKVILTIWIAQTLFNNGRVLLAATFRGNEPMANVINQLLWVGFYMVNMGFDALFLRNGAKPQTLIEAIEYNIAKIGVVLMVMGVMHFITLFVIARMSRKSKPHTTKRVAQLFCLLRLVVLLPIALGWVIRSH